VRLFFLNIWQIQRGANASRADDTKGMKGTIIDWITPPGQVITPPLNRKMKFDRGFHHETTGSLLCPAGVNWDDPEWVLVICGMSPFTVFIFSRIKAKLRSGEMHVRGDQWPLFLYADLKYDPKDPWTGLLRNQLLVLVRWYFISRLLCNKICRHTNISSPLRVPWILMSPKQLGPAMPVFMEWRQLPEHQ